MGWLSPHRKQSAGQRVRDAREPFASHRTFADWAAWLSSPNETSRRAAVAMNACIVSFFKKHLTGIDDNLLDASASRYPGVLGFSRK
jgi:hypothetical protein